VLTYLAIVSAYVPLMVTAITKQNAAQAQTAPLQAPVVPTSASNEASNAQPSTERGSRGGIGALLIGLGLLLLLACAAPFLAGVQNIIGLVIIGIAMYQAWKLNRRVPLVITGPHALAASASATTGQ
jgi:predicted cobalt transporter CbtA